MELRNLKSFIRVVEFKSFTTAADALHISQPALGMQVRKLELELGTPLLVRHSRGIEPTDAGHVLLPYAKDILDRVERAARAVSLVRGEEKLVVNVGLPNSCVFSVAFAKRSRSEMPDVLVNIVEDLGARLVDLLRQDEIRIACAFGHPNDRSIVSEPLHKEELWLVGNAADVVTSEGPINFAEFCHRPLLMYKSTGGLRGYLAGLAAEKGLSLNVIFETQSVPLIKQLMIEGFGQTVYDRTTAEDYVARDGLGARAIVDPTPVMKLWMLYKNYPPLTEAEQRVAHLLKELASPEKTMLPAITDAR